MHEKTPGVPQKNTPTKPKSPPETNPRTSFIKRFLLAHLLRNVPKKRITECQAGDYVKVTGQVCACAHPPTLHTHPHTHTQRGGG